MAVLLSITATCCTYEECQNEQQKEPNSTIGKTSHRKFEDDSNEVKNKSPIHQDSEQFSYSEAIKSTLPDNVIDVLTKGEASLLMCPFFEMVGQCPWNDSCEYVHGELCDMCFKHCLHPHDSDQQIAHKKSCVAMHEREMEKAFAIKKSEGQVCGICMEVVVDKLSRTERRFGILSGCEHCFCLTCIRKWRNSTHTSKKIIRACPLCRNVSYLVIPSEVWLTEPEEKQKLIEDYKHNLNTKPCKYFEEGKGICPFGSSCFYKHAFSDGTLIEAVPRFATDSIGQSKVIGERLLWDFIQERDNQ